MPSYRIRDTGDMATAVYDLGALVSDDLRPLTEPLAEALGREPEVIERAVAASAPRYAAGELSQGAHWDAIAAQLGLLETETIAVVALNAAPIDQTLLGHLRVQAARHTIGLLSDATPDFVSHFRRQYDLDRLFAASVIGSELDAQRDYAGLLWLSAERLQAKPAEVWFIDRKSAHLKLAAAVGMSTIRLEETTDYRAAFRPLV